MNQLLLPRFKRLMEPASWRDLSVGQAWGAVSGPVSYTHLTLPTNREV